MNYFEWSQEYYATARDLEKSIEKLKAKRENANLSKKEELDRLIAHYKIYHRDAIEAATLLMKRHRGEG